MIYVIDFINQRRIRKSQYLKTNINKMCKERVIIFHSNCFNVIKSDRKLQQKHRKSPFATVTFFLHILTVFGGSNGKAMPLLNSNIL